MLSSEFGEVLAANVLAAWLADHSAARNDVLLDAAAMPDAPGPLLEALAVHVTPAGLSRGVSGSAVPVYVQLAVAVLDSPLATPDAAAAVERTVRDELSRTVDAADRAMLAALTSRVRARLDAFAAESSADSQSRSVRLGPASPTP
jgi:hypothetical protein